MAITPGGRKGDDNASLAKAMGAAQPYVDAAWQLTGSLGLCALAGWWLDRKFDTAPWLLLSGAMFGLAAGMYSFIRRVMYLAAAEKQAKEKQAHEAGGGRKPPDVEDP